MHAMVHLLRWERCVIAFVKEGTQDLWESSPARAPQRSKLAVLGSLGISCDASKSSSKASPEVFCAASCRLASPSPSSMIGGAKTIGTSRASGFKLAKGLPRGCGSNGSASSKGIGGIALLEVVGGARVGPPDRRTMARPRSSSGSSGTSNSPGRMKIAWLSPCSSGVANSSSLSHGAGGAISRATIAELGGGGVEI